MSTNVQFVVQCQQCHQCSGIGELQVSNEIILLELVMIITVVITAATTVEEDRQYGHLTFTHAHACTQVSIHTYISIYVSYRQQNKYKSQTAK